MPADELDHHLAACVLPALTVTRLSKVLRRARRARFRGRRHATAKVDPLYWPFRILREPCRHQNATLQQAETGPASALPLRRLGAVDLPFDLAAAPGLGQDSAHQRAVRLQPGSKGRDGRSAAYAGIG